MFHRTRRFLAMVCLSLALCVPLQAQTASGPVANESGFLSTLWARVSPLFESLWAAGESTDGRGAADPDGEAVNSDSRGACDPDGVTACGS